MTVISNSFRIVSEFKSNEHNMSKINSIVSFILMLCLLTSCGFNTNPPEMQSYLNKPFAFTHDMYIEEFKSWAPGTHRITFKTVSSDFTLEDAKKAQQWETIWLGQWRRVIGVVTKGTLYRIDEFNQPQVMSDGTAYAVITVLNGPAKNLHGEIMLYDMGRAFY